MAGNGQREVSEVLTGLRRVKSGTIRIDGVDLTNAGPKRSSRPASGTFRRIV